MCTYCRLCVYLFVNVLNFISLSDNLFVSHFLFSQKSRYTSVLFFLCTNVLEIKHSKLKRSSEICISVVDQKYHHPVNIIVQLQHEVQ